MASEKDLNAAVSVAATAMAEAARRCQEASDALRVAEAAAARHVPADGWMLVPVSIREDLARLAETGASELRQIVSDTARDAFASDREANVVLGMYSDRIKCLVEFAKSAREKTGGV